MKILPECVSVLGDLVASRGTVRSLVHHKLLASIREANTQVRSLDPLRTTVGDEVQGVYATLGDALRAAQVLRDELFGIVDMRFGVGGGEVRVIDEQRGIQDGSAWSLAREAINAVEELAAAPGYGGVRTLIRDDRPAAVSTTNALVHLVEVHIAGLRTGARRSLIGMLQGLDNADVARSEGISPSANSQRVNHNSLRVLADAMHSLQGLP